MGCFFPASDIFINSMVPANLESHLIIIQDKWGTKERAEFRVGLEVYPHMLVLTDLIQTLKHLDNPHTSK